MPGDVVGHWDGSDVALVDVIGHEDPAAGRAGIEIGPGVVETGRRRVTAAAGHSGHSQRIDNPKATTTTLVSLSLSLSVLSLSSLCSSMGRARLWSRPRRCRSCRFGIRIDSSWGKSTRSRFETCSGL